LAAGADCFFAIFADLGVFARHLTFAEAHYEVSRKDAKNRKERKGEFVPQIKKEQNKSMIWVMFALGAALSWGLYGPILHKGQTELGNPFRALLCVGVAYFLIGVLVPLIALGAQGGLKDFNGGGVTWATLGGALGAAGALCIIYAFKSGGIPTYVMPLVFGGAPIINVLYSMWQHPPKTPPNPLIYVGMILVAVGAGIVLYFKPQG
jgi:uncharacterized membrane protein